MAVQLDDVMSAAMRAIAVLQRHATVCAAFVFGSQVEGVADEDSDIDIAAFIKGAENWDLRRRCRVAALVQREVGDNVELHIFPEVAADSCEPASFAAYVQEHGVPLDLTPPDKAADDPEHDH